MLKAMTDDGAKIVESFVGKPPKPSYHHEVEASGGFGFESIDGLLKVSRVDDGK